jgi:hypothetical protein
MELKDLLTVAISLSAFLLSLIATTISLRNRAQEEERTLRLLLNDVVGKIHGALIDQAKYRADNQGREGKEQNVNAAIGLFNYQ